MAVGPVASAISRPMAAGPGLKPSPSPAATLSAIRASPPAANPNPVAAWSSSPGTGLRPSRVSAANPEAASTAMPALASTALAGNPPVGTPASRPSPASARQAAPALSRLVRRPVTRSAHSTMTGALPMVTSVARLTEVSDTAVK
jgi:hypothetical protein